MLIYKKSYGCFVVILKAQKGESLRIKIVSNEKNWLESDAVRQLEEISKFKGVKDICAMPDLHPGRTPIGAVIITKGIIYPHLIGGDIGCGMSLFRLAIDSKKIKQDKLAKAAELMLQEQPKYGIGTIGAGNHFAEVQVINEIFSQEIAKKYSFDKRSAFLLVHSGSREYGHKIYDKALEMPELNRGYVVGTEKFSWYMNAHAKALSYAMDNRALIAQKVSSLNGLKCDIDKVCESVHNSITDLGNEEFCHRKGASEAIEELVVIPGSRDSLSYLVRPLANCEKTYYTLAHGAGRKWNRKFCKGRLEDFYQDDSFVTKKYKSKLVYREKSCVYEEVPECYKNIGIVINSMLQEELFEIVATLRPVLTVKG